MPHLYVHNAPINVKPEGEGGGGGSGVGGDFDIFYKNYQNPHPRAKNGQKYGLPFSSALGN